MTWDIGSKALAKTSGLHSVLFLEGAFDRLHR
jgi:hypothetical protein